MIEHPTSVEIPERPERGEAATRELLTTLRRACLMAAEALGEYLGRETPALTPPASRPPRAQEDA